MNVRKFIVVFVILALSGLGVTSLVAVFVLRAKVRIWYNQWFIPQQFCEHCA